MADVKIQMKIGDIEFSGEGEQGWVGKQLEKILNAAPTIAASAGRRTTTHSPETGGGGTTWDSSAATQSLALAHSVGTLPAPPPEPLPVPLSSPPSALGSSEPGHPASKTARATNDARMSEEYQQFLCPV